MNSFLLINKSTRYFARMPFAKFWPNFFDFGRIYQLDSPFVLRFQFIYRLLRELYSLNMLYLRSGALGNMFAHNFAQGAAIAKFGSSPANVFDPFMFSHYWGMPHADRAFGYIFSKETTKTSMGIVFYALLGVEEVFILKIQDLGEASISFCC